MSWVTVSGDHEGCAATLVSGGRRVTSLQGELMVLEDGTRVPDRETTGWRTWCSCGWRGPLPFSRVTDPDLAYRPDQVYDPAGGNPPPQVEEFCHAEWLQHVRPFEHLVQIERAAARARSADEDLQVAVAVARRSGASWEAIARAVGITRQSAHARWRHL